MRRDETHVGSKVMDMYVEGWEGSGRPKEKSIECVWNGMKEKRVNEELAADRDLFDVKNLLRRPQMTWKQDKRVRIITFNIISYLYI